MKQVKNELKKMDNRERKIHSAFEINNEMQSALARIETEFPQYREKIQTETGYSFLYTGEDLVSVDVVEDGCGIPKGSVCINVYTKYCLFSDFDEEMQKSMIELL